MSDIKIQPSATGSATVTLTAPATSTARTVTLPDSTDTLAVNSDVTNKLPLAGGTLTGAVSLTGGDLVIDQTNNGYSGLRIHDDSGGDYNSYIDLGRNQGGTRLSIRKGGRVQGTSPWQNATPDVIVSFANEGIAFHGDTAAANTLDDYEEGTATLTPVCQAGSVTLKSTHNTLKYTKIGNKVFWQYHMRIDSISSPAGWFQLTGLPFANASGEVNRVNITGHPAYNFSSPSGSMLTGYIVENASMLIPYFYNGSTGILNAAGYLQVNTEAYFSGSYSTT